MYKNFLNGVNFSKIGFNGIDLSMSSFYKVNFSFADFSNCTLIGCVFNKCDLSESNFTNAFIQYGNFIESNLSRANFKSADLSQSDFYKANLNETDFRGTILEKARLGEALNLNSIKIDKRTPLFYTRCPQQGSYIGYKRINDFIVELEIPVDALRSSATTNQCRASKAKVLSITNLDGTLANINSICSALDHHLTYVIGRTTEVLNFDTNRWKEHTTGIHHFMTREEAINY